MLAFYLLGFVVTLLLGIISVISAFFYLGIDKPLLALASAICAAVLLCVAAILSDGPQP